MVDIDEKIVQLTMENEQFESATKKSLSTLEKLKASLDFKGAGNSLDDLNKKVSNVDLSSMASGIESLQKRFSMFGTFTGRIVENLSDAFTHKLGSAFNFVKDNIIQGGIRRSMNIEKARFQLETLLKDGEVVQSVMDSAMDSVDGTAYGFDVAAKSASMFAASGVKAGEQMDKSLMALADSTAAVNGNYEQMANIFSQIAGKGRLQGDEMLQLTNQGMNAAANIAKYYKEVRNQTDMTEAKVREFASKGKISFQDFVDAMEWMYDGAAKKANETFDGAYANVKAAFARIGQGFIQPLIVKNGVLVDLLNTLRIKVNEVKKGLVFDEVLGNVDALSNQFVKFVTTISGKVSKFIQNIDVTVLLKRFYSIFHSITNVIGAWWSVAKPVFTGFISLFKQVINVDGINGFLEKIEEFTHKFNLLGRQREMFENIAKKRGRLGQTVTDEEIAAYQKLTNKIENLNKFFSGFFNLGAAIINLIKRLIASFKGVNSSMSLSTDGFFNLAGGAGEAMQRLADFLNTSQGLQAVLNGINTVVRFVGGAFNYVAGKIKEAVDWIEHLPITIHIMRNIGHAIQNVRNRFVNAFETIQTSGFSAWFKELQSEFQTSQNGLITVMRNFASNVKDWFGNLKNNFDSSQNPIVSLVRSFIDKLKTAFNFDTFKNAKEIFSTGGFKTFFESLKGDFENNFPSLFSKLDEFKDKITSFIDWIKSFFIPEMETTTVTKEMDKFFGGGDSQTLEVKSLSMDDNPTYSAMDKFREKVDSFISWFKNIKSAFSLNNISTIAGSIAALAAAFGAFKAGKGILNAGNSLSIFFKDIVGAFKQGFSIKLITGIPDAIKSLGNSLEGFQKNLKAEALEHTSKAMVYFAGSVLVLVAALAVLMQLDFGSDKYWAVKVGIVAGFMGLLIILADVVAKAAQKWKEAKTASNTIENSLNILAKGISKGVTNLSKAAKYEALTHLIEGFALSVLGIAAAILLITKTAADPNFKTGITTVAIITAVIAGMIALLAKFDKQVEKGVDEFKNVSTALLAIGTAMYVIARAIDKFMAIEIPTDNKEIAVKCGIIAAILVAMMFLVKVIGKAVKTKEGEDLYSSTALLGGIVGLTIMLVAVVHSIDKLFKMKIPTDYKTKLAMLAGVFGGLIVLVLAVAAAGKLSGGTVKMGGTLLGMAAMLVAMVGALVVLAFFPIKALNKAIKALTAVMIELAVFTIAAGFALGNKGQWKTVLATAALLVAVVAALGVLAVIPGPQLLKGAGILSAVMLVLAVCLKANGGMSNNDKWKNTLAMVGIIGAVVAALYFLADKDITSLATGAIALCGVLLVIAGAMKIMSGIKAGKDGVKMLLSEIGIIAAAGAALWAVASRDWTSIIASAVALCGVLLVVAVAMKIVSGLKFDKSGIGAIVAAVIALVAVGAVLYGLSSVGDNWPAVVAGALGIAVCLMTVAGVMAIMSSVKFDIGAIGMLAAGILAVWALAEILKPFGSGEIDADGVIKGAIAIGGSLLAIAVVMGICSLVGALATATGGIAPIAGIALLDAFLGDLWLVLKTMGKAYEDENTKKLINGGIDALCKLAEGIGRFFGTIVDSFVDAATENIAKVGTRLSDFWNEGKDFFDGIASLDPNAVQAAENLAKLILALTADELIAGIGKWLKEKLFGDNNSFAEQLTSFGEAMGAFAESVKDLDVEVVRKAAEAGTILIEMCKQIPNSGGWLGKIFGENDADMFGEQIAVFGKSIADFYNAVKDAGLDINTFEIAKECANRLIDIATLIPNSGGLLGDIVGNNDLDTFGTMIQSFGKSIVDFNKTLTESGGIDVSYFDNAYTAGKKMVDLALLIPNSGGAIASIVGDNTLSDFGKQCSDFAFSMQNFFINIQPINFGKMDEACEGFRKIMELACEIDQNNCDGVTMYQFSESLASIGTDSVNNFMEAFANGKAAANTVRQFITQITNSLDTNLTKFRECGRLAGSNYLNSIKILYPDATAVGTQFATNVILALEALYDRFKTVGENSADKYLKGIEEKFGKASDVGTLLANKVIEAIQASETAFATAGIKAGGAFVEGIASQIESAAAAGAALASAAGSVTGEFNGAIGKTSQFAASAGSGSQALSGSRVTNVTNNYSFNQTNNSPKALNQSDIYRQSNNLFSSYREAVNNP